MKVILLIDDKKLGKKGQIIEASDGYATNYLIPRKIAIAATEVNQKNLAKANAEEEAKQKALKVEIEKVKARLENIEVKFSAKPGSNGRMCGTISTKQIVEGLEQQWNIVIDKRKFLTKDQVNAFGITRLKIELYKGIAGEVIGEVVVHVTEE